MLNVALFVDTEKSSGEYGTFKRCRAACSATIKCLRLFVPKLDMQKVKATPSGFLLCSKAAQIFARGSDFLMKERDCILFNLPHETLKERRQ